MSKNNLHKFRDFTKDVIPTIERAELDRRLKFTIPCIYKEEKNTVYEALECGDPVTQSFNWNAKPGREIGLIFHRGLSVKDRPCEDGKGHYLKNSAEEIGEFLTLHGCGYYGFFKPSVEEVLAQLPAEIFDEKKLAGRKLYFFVRILNNTNVLHTSMLAQTYHIAKTFVYIDVDGK